MARIQIKIVGAFGCFPDAKKRFGVLQSIPQRFDRLFRAGARRRDDQIAFRRVQIFQAPSQPAPRTDDLRARSFENHLDLPAFGIGSNCDNAGALAGPVEYLLEVGHSDGAADFPCRHYGLEPSDGAPEEKPFPERLWHLTYRADQRPRDQPQKIVTPDEFANVHNGWELRRKQPLKEAI